MSDSREQPSAWHQACTRTDREFAEMEECYEAKTQGLEDRIYVLLQERDEWKAKAEVNHDSYKGVSVDNIVIMYDACILKGINLKSPEVDAFMNGALYARKSFEKEFKNATEQMLIYGLPGKPEPVCLPCDDKIGGTE
jgi:hypothetical protein